MKDKIYFPCYSLENKKYKVASCSKYCNKSKTGSYRFETKKAAQEFCSGMNKLKLESWNP